LIYGRHLLLTKLLVVISTRPARLAATILRPFGALDAAGRMNNPDLAEILEADDAVRAQREDAAA
jgi:hypothetical protein